MAFVFGGRKTGSAWAAALLLYYGISAYLEFHNYNFPHALPTDAQFVSTLSTWISGTATIIALTFYIDNMMLNLSRMRGGSFTLLHKYLADNGENSPVYYEMIENHIYQTGRRHKLLGDKYVLIVIAIQIESNDKNVQQEIREESFQRIQHLVRRVDIAVQMDNGHFAIVLENISTLESANSIINGITRIFYQPYKSGNRKIRVTPSLNTHIFPDEGTDVEKITANLRRRIKH